MRKILQIDKVIFKRWLFLKRENQHCFYLKHAMIWWKEGKKSLWFVKNHHDNLIFVITIPHTLGCDMLSSLVTFVQLMKELWCRTARTAVAVNKGKLTVVFFSAVCFQRGREEFSQWSVGLHNQPRQARTSNQTRDQGANNISWL